MPGLCQALAESAASRGIPATHLRTLVTHNNLSDNRWKPHVWWCLDSGGDVRCTRLFSKSRSREHQALLCQPVPAISPGGLAGLDLPAVRLAGHATSYAYFAILYRLVLERALGFHSPDGTVEIPIDLVNAFSLRGTEDSWPQALYDMGLPLRRVTPAGELVGSPDASVIAGAGPLSIRDTLVSHNFINVGLAFRLGLSVTMGAEKMTAYEAEMNEVLADFFTRIGERAYFLPRVPGGPRPRHPEGRAPARQDGGTARRPRRQAVGPSRSTPPSRAPASGTAWTACSASPWAGSLTSSPVARGRAPSGKDPRQVPVPSWHDHRTCRRRH